MSAHVPSSGPVGSDNSGGSGGIAIGMGGMTALTGLGGYVGFGGKAALPIGTTMLNGEVLLTRDGELKRNLRRALVD